LRWRLRTGGITASSPVLGTNGTVYVGVNNRLWAISPEGKKKWERDAEALLESCALMLADGTFCLVSAAGNAIKTDTELTIFHWQYPLFVYDSASPSVGQSGTIYVAGGCIGGFTALKANVSLAQSAWPKFRANPRNTGNLSDAPR